MSKNYEYHDGWSANSPPAHLLSKGAAWTTIIGIVLVASLLWYGA